nr:integrase, catalytic region, zinc finger, CCHC-type, peptidase aspartic, catalytic [Tanacetum cinerariifolium]
MMRQNKNLMDVNIDALYNTLKQNQGDVNDAMRSKKKTIMVTSDPLALIADKTNVTRSKEKVVVSSDSEGNDKKFKKKVDEKKRDMSIVKCYNCKKEGHFAKDCKKAKVKDYEYYKTKMLLAKNDKDEQVLLAEDQAWMESSSDPDQEINVNMVFMAQIEKVLSDSEASSSSADEKISEVSYYLSESESESEYETSEYYDNTTNYGLFMNDNDDQEIFHECENFYENLIESQTNHNELVVDHNDSEGIDKLCDSFDKNNLFILDDESVRISPVIKMPFRKKLRDSMNVRSKNCPDCLWIIDSGCSKHMTDNRALLTNFVKKFLGKVRFGNNDFAVIVGYGDVVIGSMTIKKVYYIMKSSTTNVESSNVEVPSHEEEVFHESSKSFQEESSLSSLNNDVQQSLEEVGVPSLNTQSIPNNMIPNVDEASTSHNVFNEHLEDA